MADLEKLKLNSTLYTDVYFKEVTSCKAKSHY